MRFKHELFNLVHPLAENPGGDGIYEFFHFQKNYSPK
jgi:hypothetical protein